MTISEAIRELKYFSGTTRLRLSANFWNSLNMAIKALEQKPCGDAISREELLKAIDTWDKFGYSARYGLERLDKDDKEYVPYIHYDDVIKCIKGISSVKQEPQTGQCKNCKWWKDSDGEYRRGISAESKCPINHREVMEGRGYCFMYERRKERSDMGYKDRKEQREITETMNKVLLPLLEYLNAETAIKIRRGLYLLSKIDIDSQESEDKE